jgi:DinB superfamily
MVLKQRLMTTCPPVRPGASEIAPHARTYVDLVPERDIEYTLEHQIEATLELLKPVEDGFATEFSYAPDKWTIKQIIGHLTDTERIFSCRALRIARGDTTPLPGFEQDDYVRTASSNERTLAGLIAEFRSVRQSTLALFESFSAEAWMRKGRVNDWNLSVRGIAFTMAGHELHHAGILRERYLQPVNRT